jgi:glucosyl-dolichyl phosphate glucuronosyltransferase
VDLDPPRLVNMKLTVIVPTYNRAQTLRKTLDSLATAALPPDFDVNVIVVDNNSTDNTSAVVEEMAPRFVNVGIKYLFEPRQGRSFAVNSGLSIADGDLISTIDDDEQVDKNWYVEIKKIFNERWEKVDFVGGKILPNLEVDPPEWVEPLKEGALCWRDFGDDEWSYDQNSPMITGAHGIFKKSVFDKIGFYNEALGVKGKGFLGGEDEVFYDQVIAASLQGIYHPKLVVYHDVPARRLTKAFYRRWLIGVGRSRRLADLHYKPIPGTRLFAIPRWMYKWAAGGIYQRVKYAVLRDKTRALEAENKPLVFLGFFYATHIEGGRLERVFLNFMRKSDASVTR